ncbi:hypothetical protein ACW2Q0_30075, partial [Nocardia sp. R16R-3T]
PPRLSRPTDVPEDSGMLIDMLWRFYIAADAPPVREIARVIKGLPEDQQKGTANPETVRRTLIAKALPQWETVEVIFLALCQIANVDPDDVEPDEDRDQWDPPPQSHRAELHQRYRKARYGKVTPLPRTRADRARLEAEAEAEMEAYRRGRQGFGGSDPWGSAPGSFGGSSDNDDEPPF